MDGKPPSIPLSASTTSPSDWKYISEGGATIVFSYQGSTDTRFDGTVLRLRKSAGNTQHFTPSSGPTTPGADDEEPDDPMIEFQQKIIARLIPEEYLVCMHVIHLERLWLEAFAQLHESERPSERRLADSIDLTRCKGVLATDLVGSEGCVVEIKSKGDPAAVDYCPLDLFSGTSERVTKATHGLWDSWMQSGGAVNNLRIFSDGKMLKPSDDDDVAKWARTTFGCSGTSELGLRDKFTAALLPILLDTPVFQRLGTLQRTLDTLDREGISKLRERAQMLHLGVSTDSVSPPPFDADPPEPVLKEWSSFIDTYVSSHDTRNHGTPEPSDLRYYLLAYLLSATFKDCSLMIRLSPESTQPVVKVIDLDTKSVRKIRNWEKLDQQILDAYRKVDVDARKRCVDGWSRLAADASQDGDVLR
ncbi:hypothetical protein EWM64_g1818 [Hericium alpestre]|uniref:Inositol-pentakisphosphate 2-kinase n=1 Tax=Hericium alpestre TaxID=135208 RepID=A0A4Z0A7E2_9AGAM|nr:hypothetical protein EWM64_g1818 [Hericium alpestre]